MIYSPLLFHLII